MKQSSVQPHPYNYVADPQLTLVALNAIALLQFLLQRVALFIPIISASIVAVIRYSRKPRTIPISINYNFSRKCNETCGFCFHTAKTSFILPENEAKRGLRLLQEAGMQKINFTGDEPFLYPKFLSKMLQYCKEDLHLESVSIVTNGSKVTERFLQQYGQYIDVLAVSCDLFDEKTNIAIGRGDGDNVAQLFKIRDWCRAFNIKFKLNTVVNRLNFREDMVSNIEKLQPFRWKVFQVLMVKGENDSEATLTDVRKFEIEDHEYQVFCDKHSHIPFFIPESNRVMASSYLLLDEYMRFLDKGEGQMTESESLLDVGVEEALEQVRWD